jgi:acyl carrier protein
LPFSNLAEVRNAVHDVWSEILHADPSDSDDFFALGGDSLSMIRLLMLIEDRLGVELSIEELFVDSFTFGACVATVAGALGASGVRAG